MPYREQVAWLYLGGMAITFGPYLAFMAMSPPSAPMPDLSSMSLFALAATALVILLGLGHLALRLWSPEDAAAPPDERDRAIAQRSVRAAYHVLIGGMVLVGCVMPFSAEGWSLVNAAIGMIVLAEAIHHGTTLWSYRRGWHG